MKKLMFLLTCLLYLVAPAEAFRLYWIGDSIKQLMQSYVKNLFGLSPINSNIIWWYGENDQHHGSNTIIANYATMFNNQNPDIIMFHSGLHDANITDAVDHITVRQYKINWDTILTRFKTNYPRAVLINLTITEVDPSFTDVNNDTTKAMNDSMTVLLNKYGAYRIDLRKFIKDNNIPREDGVHYSAYYNQNVIAPWVTGQLDSIIQLAVRQRSKFQNDGNVFTLTPKILQDMSDSVKSGRFPVYRGDAVGRCSLQYFLGAGDGYFRSDSVIKTTSSTRNACIAFKGYVPPATVREWSFYCWFKTSATSGYGTLAAQYAGTAGIDSRAWQVFMDCSSGKIYANVTQVGTGGATTKSFYTNNVLNNGVLHFFAFTFNRGDLKLIVDGYEDYVTKPTDGSCPSFTGYNRPIYAFAQVPDNNSTFNNKFVGSIYGMGMYDTALTGIDFKAIYDNGVNINHSIGTKVSDTVMTINPVIPTQLHNDTVSAGTSVMFFVQHYGADSVVAFINGTRFAKNDTITFTATSEYNGATIYFVAYNAINNVQSNTATLTVEVRPVSPKSSVLFKKFRLNFRY